MAKGRWKIERFSAELMPNVEGVFQTFAKLSLRDAAIYTAASLDLALAELIEKRLNGPPEEVIAFIGANEDGRAPCGSFGSRIQLALLLGLITKEDASLLRKIKKLRNIMAHRINVALSDQDVNEVVLSIWTEVKAPIWSAGLQIFRLKIGEKQIWEKFKSSPEYDVMREKLTEAEKHFPEIDAALKPFINDVFQKWKMKPSKRPLVDLFAVAHIFIGRIELAATWMLLLLFAIYVSRFKLILSTVERISQTKLPKYAEKMWESDQLAE